MTSKLRGTIAQFGRYVSVGLITNCTAYLAFLAFISVGIHPVISSALCYFLALGISYALNRNWTFRSAVGHRRDLPRFLFAYALGLLFAVGCIAVCLIWMRPALAQFVTIGLTALVVYGSLNILHFGQSGEGHVAGDQRS